MRAGANPPPGSAKPSNGSAAGANLPRGPKRGWIELGEDFEDAGRGDDDGVPRLVDPALRLKGWIVRLPAGLRMSRTRGVSSTRKKKPIKTARRTRHFSRQILTKVFSTFSVMWKTFPTLKITHKF